ncbi:MAG: arginine--tRNA ligase [Deltaproteobacteria bacterium]
MSVNLIKKIREQVIETIKGSIAKACELNLLPQIDLPEHIFIEVPKEKANGDFSTNIAMQLARTAKMPPRQIADYIVSNADISGTYIKEIKTAGAGFINFYINNEWIYEVLPAIVKENENYGKSDYAKGQKVMVEFVSANPTGPLHMGNARGGALGDCIAAVLEAVGCDVTREFYVNDAGNQIELLGQSLEARYIQLIKGEDAAVFPENGYQGEDIIEHMKAFIEINGEKYLESPSDERKKAFAEYALKKNLERIKNGLSSYGVEFDVWFSEKSLHDSGQVKETIELMAKNGHTYEKEGAIWFKATDFGLDKDDVLIRANGIPTYFAADIAYHRNKFLTRNFDRVINLWGADHHGHVARVKAGVAACGINPDKLDVVLFQLVRLLRNGEVARMSKRKGTVISVEDLIEEVGRDSARFFFNNKQAETHMDFDLDLAVAQSNENPVFYIQYAHARICSIIRILQEEGVKLPEVSEINAALLSTQEETELIRKLIDLPEEIVLSARDLEPSRLTRYLFELASLFHSFYNVHRIKGEAEEILKARLVLVDCVRIVIRNVLGMLAISAPERM